MSVARTSGSGGWLDDIEFSSRNKKAQNLFEVWAFVVAGCGWVRSLASNLQ
jgi:hypothetical protein